MKEIIFIHIGQAGVQIGEQLWQGFAEHNKEQLFREKENGLTGRAIFIDLDGEMINTAKKRSIGHLISDENTIGHKEDTAGIYIRGHYTLGRVLTEKIQERILKESEACDNLQGFVLTYSIGGGTGSGLGAQILSYLNVYYSKNTKINFAVFPWPRISHHIVEPYNSVLGFEGIYSDSDACFVLDNQALFNICSTKIGTDYPTYTNLNQLIAFAMTSVLNPSIYGSSLNSSLSELVQNLCLDNNRKFLTASYAPLTNNDSLSISDLTSQVFSPDNHVSRVVPSKYLTSTLHYKGDVLPNEISMEFAHLKSKTSEISAGCSEFSINCGYDSSPFNPTDPAQNRSATLLCNTNGISPAFEEFLSDYQILYKRRSFVHWYVGEGLSEGFFESAEENLKYYLNSLKE